MIEIFWSHSAAIIDPCWIPGTGVPWMQSLLERFSQTGKRWGKKSVFETTYHQEANSLSFGSPVLLQDYVRHFASITPPPSPPLPPSQIKRDSRRQIQRGQLQCQETFKIQQTLNRSPVPLLPSLTQYFILGIDASSKRMRICLLQKKNDILHPVQTFFILFTGKIFHHRA